MIKGKIRVLDIASSQHAQISCRNSLGKITYVVEHLGEHRLPELFAGILDADTLVSHDYQYLGQPLTLVFFKDINNWYNNGINLKIFENMTAMGIDAFRTGYFTVISAKQTQNLATIAYLQMLGPEGIIKRLNSINQIYNRTKTMELLESTDTSGKLLFSYRKGCSHSQQVTRQNIGVAVALMELAGFQKVTYHVEHDDFGADNHTLLSICWKRPSKMYQLRWLSGKIISRMFCQTYLKSDDVIGQYHQELLSSFECEIAEKEQQRSKTESYYHQLLEQQELKEQELVQLVKLKTGELEQSLDDKQQLFENFSHELKTPLTLIIGPLEQLLKQELPSPLQQSLVGVNRNAHRLYELVSSLLNLAEIKINRDKKGVTHIHQCTHYIVNSLQPLADNAAATVSVAVECEDNLTLYLQVQTWELILTNLLTNAIKHGGQGAIIQVRVKQTGDELILSVVDSNKPISVQQQQDIFSRFSSSDSKNKGHGLGLAIVKELSEHHLGKVELEVTTAGNCFRVMLPLSLKADASLSDQMQSIDRQSDELEDLRIHQDQNMDSAPGKDVAKVLLVEDNQELAEFMISALGQNLSVIHCVNGKDALQALDKEIVELIISDVMMPVMDGYEFCQRVKNDQMLRHIPLFLLTAKSDIESQKHGLALNADDYIGKPFNADILIQKIHNVIKTNRALAAELKQKLTLSSSVAIKTEVWVPEQDEKGDFLNRVQTQLQCLFSCSDVKAADIAAELHMSEKTLNRKLKLIIGCSVAELLSEYRLNRATEMLTAGHAIKEVCFDCGFNSQSYFSRSFKQKFGYPPSEYVARNRMTASGCE